MEEIKLNRTQNKNNSYTKINTEDDNEMNDFNYEKELTISSSIILLSLLYKMIDVI